MVFDIVLHKGAGDIRFGMTVDEVRKAVGKPVSPFMKTPESVFATDAFDGEGLHVYYKPPGGCVALEFGAPARPMLDGEELLGVSFRDGERLVRRRDPNCLNDESGLISHAIGVALYCIGHEEDPQALIEGVFVFEDEYCST